MISIYSVMGIAIFVNAKKNTKKKPPTFDLWPQKHTILILLLLECQNWTVTPETKMGKKKLLQHNLPSKKRMLSVYFK